MSAECHQLLLLLLLLCSIDEATHGFAVVASPVDQAFNYWEWIEGYSTKACLRKRRDRVTKNFYAATNIAYR